ncbi:MAG: hypothetical protein BWX70_02182 [Verrucomicrobia bacterium ADurb.Bin070]|nr:MAG: hypothetical protein BWX70_02182 [Verrucomicrobia bacterium ADurb.Bin070]
MNYKPQLHAEPTPAIARQSHALPPICHAEQAAKGRIADEGQKPANRPETGKAGMANRGRLTTERAKVLGKIGGDKFAASKRGKSTLPRCVGCLLAIGWGIKRIVRHTGWAKTSVHRWAKFNGLNLRATAEQKKRAASKAGWNRRKRTRKPDGYMLRAFVAECGILRSQEANHWPRRTIVKRGVLTIGTQMDLYYADHEKSKERSRVAALTRYYREAAAIKAGAEPSRYWVARRIRSRVYNVLRNALAKKNVRTEELCGCSWGKLIEHIEAQFYARMSWQNYGRAWHIDHIMPCDSFDLRDERQQRQCFHYTNLRPMWAKANRKKWATVTDPQFRLLLPAE